MRTANIPMVHPCHGTEQRNAIPSFHVLYEDPYTESNARSAMGDVDGKVGSRASSRCESLSAMSGTGMVLTSVHGLCRSSR